MDGVGFSVAKSFVILYTVDMTNAAKCNWMDGVDVTEKSRAMHDTVGAYLHECRAAGADPAHDFFEVGRWCRDGDRAALLDSWKGVARRVKKSGDPDPESSFDMHLWIWPRLGGCQARRLQRRQAAGINTRVYHSRFVGAKSSDE